MSNLRKSNRNFTGILVAVALIGIVAIAIVMSRPPKVLVLPQGAGASLAAKGVVVGSPDALVEIVEFGDFECPGCGYFATVEEPDIMARLVATGEMRFRFMDFPLDIHRNAVAAHNAAACANEQGKFWEMHDGLYRNQDRWNSQAARDPKRAITQIARDAGVDLKAWEACYDSGKMLEQIAANRREGERLQVRSTPSFKIGDNLYPGSITYDQMRAYVAAEKVRLMASQSLETGKKVTVEEAKKAAATKTP